MDYSKVFHINDKLFVGLPGLLSDSQTLYVSSSFSFIKWMLLIANTSRANKLRHRVNLYNLREGRQISPKVFSNVISSVLYGKRFGPFFVEVILLRTFS